MASWTEQMGFPLLTVKSFSGTALELEQSWFLADGSDIKPEEEKSWKIPLMYSCDGGEASKPELVVSKVHTLEVPKAGIVVLNAGRHVPMRVLYTKEMYVSLAAAVGKGLLSVPDRAGLILDSFALAKA